MNSYFSVGDWVIIVGYLVAMIVLGAWFGKDQRTTRDYFLGSRDIPYEQDERDYRYSDGREQPVPLARFEAGEIGVDIALFGLDDLRRTPLSPADGLPMKRLKLAEAEALAAIGAADILGGA